MTIDELEDRRREVLIRELTNQVAEAYYAGRREEARMLDQQRMDAIRARSAAQVERMERATYLSMDTASRRIFDQHKDGNHHA